MRIHLLPGLGIRLLIVLNGIETKFCASMVVSANTFNRTKWN